MDLLLFAFYLLLFSWLVTKLRFFKASGLTNTLLVSLFLCKIIASVIYGWQGVRYSYLIQMGDTWRWHFYSLQDLAVLKKTPLLFFKDLSNTYEHGYSGFLSSRSSWWNDLHRGAFTKLLAVFNFFSLKNYFINSIFYSFVTFVGGVAFFRTVQDAFPGNKKANLITVFLLPSFLYWCSGIHKDGLTFLGLSLVIFVVYFYIKHNQFSIYRLIALVLGLGLLLLYRNYILIVLLPALLTWIIAEKLRTNVVLTFVLAYFLFFIAFFTLPLLTPKLNLPKAVVEKQEDFLTLKGNSFVPVKKLEPNIQSFLKTAPYALELTVLRPFPSDAKHPFSVAAFIENLFLLFIICFFIFFHKRQQASPFFWFCLFLSLSIFLIIGYTVNFLGAIVRYRSLVFPLLITALVYQTDWWRIKSSLYNK
ncbi:MAG: hypothetical protein JWP88_2187 [Flaviaesturariibacter sp.]|nr:hypothetical protein [Flaviaesturariibacter sp.]